jgi:hypothetical protein
MAISNDVFMVSIPILIYVVFGLSWEFNLTGKAEDRKFNVIKLLLMWLLVWLCPLFIQAGLEFAVSLGRDADIITLFETLYTVSMYVAIFISMYFMIFIGYNAMLMLANVTGGKK